VYALRGFGIAHSFAIEAPNGWIVVDTGDSTRAAAEMRETLERAVGKKIRVAAIPLTHWHYVCGTVSVAGSVSLRWRQAARPIRRGRLAIAAIAPAL